MTTKSNSLKEAPNYSSFASLPSSCTLLSCIVGSLAGIALMRLGMTHYFGPKGSPGFMRAVVAGGALTGISGGVLVWQTFSRCQSLSKDLREPAVPPRIEDKVLETLRSVATIPGLTPEELSALKTEIITTWMHLKQEGVWEVQGRDKDIRPQFVALQGVIEHILASELKNSIVTLKGIIHTPMPATPLCSKGEISPHLVDPSMASDPARLSTVKVRTTILRDYLFKGGDLYVVYPKGGYAKRTPEQQEIYQQELKNYPDHLFDRPLDCESIPEELIGATYLFEDRLGNAFAFSIKMTQAKDPQESGHFGLWFGSVRNAGIQKRLQTLSSYLEPQGVHIFPAKGKEI